MDRYVCTAALGLLLVGCRGLECAPAINPSSPGEPPTLPAPASEPASTQQAAADPHAPRVIATLESREGRLAVLSSGGDSTEPRQVRFMVNGSLRTLSLAELASMHPNLYRLYDSATAQGRLDARLTPEVTEPPRSGRNGEQPVGPSSPFRRGF